MAYLITLATKRREELVDITSEVNAIVRKWGHDARLCALYAQGATGAIMIQEIGIPDRRGRGGMVAKARAERGVET